MSRSARIKNSGPKDGARTSTARRKTLARSKERRGLDASDIALPIGDKRIAALATQVHECGGAQRI